MKIVDEIIFSLSQATAAVIIGDQKSNKMKSKKIVIEGPTSRGGKILKFLNVFALIIKKMY